jgi:LacI family transcriptional regulator, galactose operon repressor
MTGPTGFNVSQAATLYDVAREAGVSTATVSRVVHNQDTVRPATRKRVLEVIEALGYIPDGAAQSMARQRKEVIGLLAADSRSPDTDVEEEGLLFAEEVLRGVEFALRDIQWSLLISLLRGCEDPAAAFRRIQKIAAKVDGMLVIEGTVRSDHLGRLAARMPIVLIAGAHEEPHADVFSVDNYGGTRVLVQHLIAVHGVRTIYEISGPPEAPDARERHAALHEAVAGHGSAAVIGTFQGCFAAMSGQLAVKTLLSSPREHLPDALVCANDQMAIGAIRELQASGLRVPGDIAVVGFDAMYSGALITPSVTTARQSARLLGERACSRLLQRIENPALERHSEYLPAELVIRQSCGCGSLEPDGKRPR